MSCDEHSRDQKDGAGGGGFGGGKAGEAAESFLKLRQAKQGGKVSLPGPFSRQRLPLEPRQRLPLEPNFSTSAGQNQLRGLPAIALLWPSEAGLGYLLQSTP